MQNLETPMSRSHIQGNRRNSKARRINLRDSRNDPEYRFARTIQHRVESLICRSSVPIFAADLDALGEERGILVVRRPPIAAVASGILIENGGAYFVVTAFHVVRDFQLPGRQLRLSVGNPPHPQPIPIRDEDLAIDEQNDVAVIRLQPHIVAQLHNVRFLEMSDIALDANIEGQYCAIFGYLGEGTHATKDFTQIRLHNFFLWTTSYDRHVATTSYDKSRHILVGVDPFILSMRDGILSPSPSSLGGLSGAALWSIFRPEDVERGWSEEKAKVVAVEHLAYDNHIIQCIRWECVLPILASLASSRPG